MVDLKFPRRAQLAAPADLVDDWPADYWREYKHPNPQRQAQLKIALGLIQPKLEAWMKHRAPVTPGFLMYGRPGYGKTGTGLTLLDQATRWGYTAKFITAERLAMLRDSTEFGKKNGLTQAELLDQLLAPEVLFIDDVGTREYPATVRALIFELVRDRPSRTRGITIMSTNVELGTQDGRAYWTRAVDPRILSTYQGYAFNSADWGTPDAPAASLRMDR